MLLNKNAYMHNLSDLTFSHSRLHDVSLCPVYNFAFIADSYKRGLKQFVVRCMVSIMNRFRMGIMFYGDGNVL